MAIPVGSALAGRFQEPSIETSGHAPRRATEDENCPDVFSITCETPPGDFRGSLDAADTSVRATTIIVCMNAVSSTVALCALSIALAQAQVKLPDGEGKELVEKICSGCHGLDTAVADEHTETEWRKVVD